MFPRVIIFPLKSLLFVHPRVRLLHRIAVITSLLARGYGPTKVLAEIPT